ncbi:hypothetical protein AQJ43_23650 [Streptomyces avermitilis]|uniref:Uncharacterized protein n=2 Tax=Streptomyces avermitilis TaxID=33903 RepID=Q82C20_STRAW|nr:MULTISPECIES: hypothetical protein [Streptomyces]KUN52224.1 hypothetical protein AQJ43_23650 [Streptomyces avermitilis]MYT01114.1 hypothetical protein [Streptomyces sp. SID5469]OOV30728.1 hypothetical protein SM007_16120 [Streptomyces avermitilis]BAC73246.1 hypothetical protein SAVERM_5534 [Streptomyces avermitilis MA-4680 = NBRC 14893]BBJ53690.1 hypothetical protein SAVMC3_63190 [Streptomyces avermitilis]
MNLYECFVCGTPQEAKTCDRCRSRIRGDLSALPELYRGLEGCRQRGQNGGGDGRSSKRLHAPVPGDERVLNLLGPASRQPVTDARDQTGETPFLALLESWCQAVSEERALDHVKTNVTAMTAMLTAHLPWICDQPWVVEFAEEIRALVHTVQRITMTQPRKELLRGVTCPSCEGLTLVRHFPGDWSAECALCPSVRLDERDYRLLVQSQAQGLTA